MGDNQVLEKWDDYLLNNYLNENIGEDIEERWAYEEDRIDYMEDF